MSYIGRGLDKISNIEKLDAITFDGSQSYSLTKSSVAFTPNSANSLIISINGVCQFGNVTVSGTSVDFGVAMPSTDTNDFILHLGVGLVTNVADGAITTARIGDGAVTSAKLSAGKILQVVNSTVGQTDIAGTDDYIGAGCSITPSSTSSKVQIFVDGYVEQTTGSTGDYSELEMREGTTGITTLSNAITYQYTVGARIPFSINFTRSPSTTSAVQYRLYNNNISGTATNRYYQQAWTLMEVAG